MKLPEKLQKKIEQRIKNNTLRSLGESNPLFDFSSNDYLGFSKNSSLLDKVSEILQKKNIQHQGATGSRLLSGNHKLYTLAESAVASFHESETALIFNSGYDANIGFFQSVPQRGDVILYDEYIHASIRDGLTMSHAKSYKFMHNDLGDLEKKIANYALEETGQEIYVVTESVFSMDGDTPDLLAMQTLCDTHNAHLVVDEAHATGVIGRYGQGLVQQLGLENKVFALIVTFGKAIGVHGAAILCNEKLREYLINFARSFIYTTALPPHTLATILVVYDELSFEVKNEPHSAITKLQNTIGVFTKQLETLKIKDHFIPSYSAIHCMIVPGSSQVSTLSRKLKQHGYNVKPILAPTVPEGQERLRFCLHSEMTEEKIKSVLSLLESFIHESIT